MPPKQVDLKLQSSSSSKNEHLTNNGSKGDIERDVVVPPRGRNGAGTNRVGTSRVGSNRERTHDWERGKGSLEKESSRGFEKHFGRNDRYDKEDNDRFGRKSGGGGRYDKFSEFEHRVNSGGGYRNNHHYNHHSYGHREEVEPEWMTEGPTSQSETIELKGFEEDEKKKEEEKKVEKVETRRNDSGDGNSSNSGNHLLAHLENLSNNKQKKIEPSKPPEESHDFDINEIFKFDNWQGGPSSEPNMAHGVQNNTEAQGSRFAQWFNNSAREDSPIDRLLSNVSFLNDSSDSELSHNNSANSLGNSFTMGQGEKRNESGSEKDIMNLFQKANINLNQLMMQQRNNSINPSSNAGVNLHQAKSVAELEASLKQNTLREEQLQQLQRQQQQQQHHQQQQHKQYPNPFNYANHHQQLIDSQLNHHQQLQQQRPLLPQINNSSTPSNTSTQSAFTSLTPTSVIRKIASEKDREILQKMVVVPGQEEFAKKQQQHQQQQMSSQSPYPVVNGLASDHLSSPTPPPTFRPIVKGNMLHPSQQQQQQHHSSMDSEKLSKMVEQHRAHQQQQQAIQNALAVQRQMNSSPTINPGSGGMRFGPTPQMPPVSGSFQVPSRPDPMAPTNVIRNMVQSGAINPAVHSTVMNPLHIQQYIQQQQQPATTTTTTADTTAISKRWRPDRSSTNSGHGSGKRSSAGRHPTAIDKGSDQYSHSCGGGRGCCSCTSSGSGI